MECIYGSIPCKQQLGANTDVCYVHKNLVKRVDEFSFLIILNANWIELKYFWTLDLCLNVEFDIPTLKSGPWEELVWGRDACFRGKFPPKPPVGMRLWGYLRQSSKLKKEMAGISGWLICGLAIL